MIALLLEAWRSARATPVVSAAALILIAGMCVAVLVTAGRAVGAQEAVLGTIDAAGTRTVIVRADAEAGLDSTVLDRLRGLDGVEWASAFGPAVDGRNAAIPNGQLVPVRVVWGDGAETLPMGSTAASRIALEQLGMLSASGTVVTTDGVEHEISQPVAVPEGALFLEPLVVARSEVPGPVAVLVVVVESADLVAPLGDAVRSLLGDVDPSAVSVESSEQLAALRGVLQHQLESRNRELVVGVLAVTAVLVAAIMHALGMLRRKDYGRRRALGASRRLIIALVLAQAAILSLAGAVAGSAIAVGVLQLASEPRPGIGYIGALVVLSTALGTVAALVPAVVASRREPIVEMRVP